MIYLTFGLIILAGMYHLLFHFYFCVLDQYLVFSASVYICFPSAHLLSSDASGNQVLRIYIVV